MDILLEKTLDNGEKLRVLRWHTGQPAPAGWYNYMAASTGEIHPYGDYYDAGLWRTFYRDALLGISGEEGLYDTLYIAEINGEFASRMWFGYCKRTNHGNFGNVYTEVKFRRRGLMHLLLDFCVADFQASPAVMLTCATGNSQAARAYVGAGFQMIFGGETGPLTLTKKGTFEENANPLMEGSSIVTVRRGERDDQFECDKVLTYTRCIWKGGRIRRRGPASRIPDFRTARFEQAGERCLTAVAENAKKTVVGYAFNCWINRQRVVDFVLHENYDGDGAKLLNAVNVPEEPAFFYAAPENKEKIAIAESAGFRKVAELPQWERYGEGYADLWLYRK